LTRSSSSTKAARSSSAQQAKRHNTLPPWVSNVLPAKRLPTS
jgi:hypothetical protein